VFGVKLFRNLLSKSKDRVDEFIEVVENGSVWVGDWLDEDDGGGGKRNSRSE